jgi:CheY-like chemotaxis protein
MTWRNGYSVMVVEDEADIREGIAEWLDSLGYEIVAASNGREALQYLRTSGQQPDAILLDMMMPIMDGISFRWEQLADKSLRDIPVIILSASGHCHESAIELNTAGVLKKPCKPDALLEMLSRVCQTAH